MFSKHVEEFTQAQLDKFDTQTKSFENEIIQFSGTGKKEFKVYEEFLNKNDLDNSNVVYLRSESSVSSYKEKK